MLDRAIKFGAELAGVHPRTPPKDPDPRLMTRPSATRRAVRQRSALACFSLLLIGCSALSSSREHTSRPMESPKAIVAKAMNALFAEYSEEGVTALFSADYVQHNPNVPTGR